MHLDSLRLVRARLLSSRHTWVVLGLLYFAMIAIVLAPVLFASVGGDDRYWLLIKGPNADGSVLTAFWQPLSHAFAFDNQPRTTALALSERSIVAVVAMDIATYFSIPPVIVWACLKIVLVALLVVATRVFLHQIQFRDSRGRIRGLERSSVAFISILLPLTIAIGAKAQNINSINGWNFYPTLTYGAFTAYLFFAALVLRLSRALDRDYRSWAIPVIALMAVSGLAINLSYEMLALLLPITFLVLALQPLDAAASSRWLQWRGRVTVLLALAIPYSTLFLWIRWRISQMACQVTDSCYNGSVIDVSPRALVNNFRGALPGQNGALVSEQADAAGRAFPTASTFSFLVAIVAAAAAWGLWVNWQARHTTSPEDAEQDGRDTRGLLIVLAVCVSIALGSAAITGITERAGEDLTTPAIAYRSGVATWSALSVSGLVLVLLASRARHRAVSVGAFAALTAVLIGSVALYLPRNVQSAQLNRQVPGTQFADTVQREVTLGDTSKAGDLRRCATMAQELERFTPTPGSGNQQLFHGAYLAFDFYHHTTYCSKRIGIAP